MDKREIRFDLSADALLDMAEAKLDEEDYIAALRLLHKSLEMYGPGADEYADLAEAYDGMEQYEYAAYNWFRFLDVCAENEAVDAYEGLAACYYNLGNMPQAMYYYNKMMHDKYVTAENNVEMGELMNEPPRPRFRVAWPPEHADYSADVDDGLQALKQGDHAKAERCFRRVHPDSPYYPSAMNYLAVSYLLSGSADKAERVCDKLLRQEPDNVQILSTYAAALIEQDRREEGRAVAARLASIETEDADELYKIATVCCENGLYEQAYDRFCKIEEMVRYDLTLLYFKGVAAFRCGKVKESLAALGKLLDIDPHAAVARHYFRKIRDYAESGGEPPETAFFYRVPQAEREANTATLMLLLHMSASDQKALCSQPFVYELLEWCFDEADGQEPRLQLIAAEIAAHADLQPFFCDLLLNASVNDVVKLAALQHYCERNRDFECGIVVSDIYGRVAFRRLQVGRKRRALFVGAYALCFARFGLFGNVDGEELCCAVQNIYELFAARGDFSVIRTKESLACAIYLTVRTVESRKMGKLIHGLGAEETEVLRILEAIRVLAAGESEAAASDAAEPGEAGAPAAGEESADGAAEGAEKGSAQEGADGGPQGPADGGPQGEGDPT